MKSFIKIDNTSSYIRFDWVGIEQQDQFTEIIKNNLPKSRNYIIQFKIRYENIRYIMLGTQLGFNFTTLKDINTLYVNLLMRIQYALDEYSINSKNFNYVIMIFKDQDDILLSDITYDKSRVKNTEIKNMDKSIKIPISEKENLLGTVLEVAVSEKEEKVLILPKPHKNIVVEDQFYVDTLQGKTKTFFRPLNPAHLLSITDLSDNIKEKSISSLDGDKIITVKDTYNEDSIVRSQNKSSKTYQIVDNEIVSFSKDLSFIPIEKPKPSTSYHRSLLLGVIDLETYYDASDNTSKVYAGGFKTYLEDRCITKYVSEDIDNNKIIIDIINEIIRPKYANIKFYVHNLGDYDSIYILKALYEYNENNEDKFIVDPIFNKNKTLRITIRKKVEGKMWKTTIIDSIAMLNASLRELAYLFEVPTKKGHFPYKFVQPNTLFYKGNTPDISMYQNIDLITYKDQVSDMWDVKKETIQYLEKDLNSLFEILNKYSKYIYRLFDVEFSDSLTISSLSLNIFLNKYYKSGTVANIKNKTVFSDIKLSYYGGINEIYKPYGKNLYLYDVNSLYPFVAMNTMPGLNALYHEYLTDKELSDDMFGFYYAEVDNRHSDNVYFGILPHRTQLGLQFPIGNWQGWFFSEELKFAIANGYSVKIRKGYTFDKQDNVFDEYIREIYKLKSAATDNTERTMAKSLLNNLLGRFGMDINKPITKIVNLETYNNILLTSPIISEEKITNNAYLITYLPILDKALSESLNIDPQKAFEKFEHLLESESPKNINRHVSVAVSAAITSYARIHINKLKYTILKLGGNVYYCDTDSIVTDIELPSDLVSPNELGKLKLVYQIKEAYFISNKTYALTTLDNKIIKKSTGLNSGNLTFEDYKNLYLGNDIGPKFRLENIKNYTSGSVNLENRKVNLDPFSYKKREKIYTKGIWTDTKPIEL